MKTYELIIIGGGPGGYHAASLAAKFGIETLVIEKYRLGGVCLNEGCIPSKTLLNSAKYYTHTLHGELYGVYTQDVVFKLEEVIKRKNRVVKNLVEGVKYKLKTAKVTVVEGHGQILKKENNEFIIQVKDELYRAKKLMIATGSAVFMPPITGLNEALKTQKVLTSKEILDLTELPKTLTVIGGGVIGLEMASFYSQLGSRVTVIEMLSSIGGYLDLELSKELQKTLEQEGITFKLNAKVTTINEHDVTYTLNNETHKIEHDYALLSVGRKANTLDVGLQNIHVELHKNGSIITDHQLRTNIVNVYAIGDVNGKSMLAHVAYKEAEVAINTILGIRDQINYEIIPSIIYTSPEVGMVGLTEQQAKEKGYKVKVIKLPVSYSGRHLAETNDKQGFVKLIFDNKKQTLIGAHMMSLYASEIILFLSSMIDLEINIDTLKRLIYPHPTVGELIKDALFHI